MVNPIAMKILDDSQGLCLNTHRYRSEVAVGGDMYMYIYDIPTQKVGLPFGKMSKVSTFALKYSPSGNTLAAGRSNGHVELWDVPTTSMLTPGLFFNHGGYSIRDLAWNALGTKVAFVAPKSDHICVWDTTVRKLGQTPAYIGKGKASYRSVDCHAPSSVYIFQAGTRDLIAKCDTPEHVYLYRVAISPYGKHVAVTINRVSPKKSPKQPWICVYGRYTGEQIATSPVKHQSPIRDIAFSPDGNYIVSGGEDGTLRLWEVESQDSDNDSGPVAPSNGGTKDDNIINGVAFSPDGDYVIAVTKGYDIYFWDVSGKGLQFGSFSDGLGGDDEPADDEDDE
ncbi:hypothetical protein M422DRAFT_43044 [Sphaerobolus stellatus SS14]|nr:hypothetical protein M422DRAFT_43044 [Sphaerobolus stellatus SS14]